MIRFSQLSSITGGKIIQQNNDSVIRELLTDSRKATSSPDAVFFAIKGFHHDGHDYIQQLADRGVRNFVVECEVQLDKEVNILQVSSALEALQKIAAAHRERFQIPIIGITGSNAKTIVKEWLFQLLSDDYKVSKNPGSYNSQIGVPLSVWQLQNHHELGIFEAGISKPGEMEKLEPIIHPTIGVFTNIGSAHDEGFVSRTQKVTEKLKLFSYARVIIYCKQHQQIDEIITQSALPALSWGSSSTASIHVQAVNNHYSVSFKGVSFTLRLPFNDVASIENAFHCVAAMLHLGYSGQEIQSKVEMLQSIPMRLELKEGINQSQIIDDTYNNDLAGLQISLDFLANQHQKSKKRLILSDIHESGLASEKLAEELSALISRYHLHAFVGIGELFLNHREKFKSAEVYPSTEEFIRKFDVNTIQHEIILVKGARKFQFEKIISRLQRKVHGTIMQIDLGAIVHNLNYFKSLLHPQTKVMAMVKAFAYGSGSTEIANLLQYHKIDYLGVAYADEGIELRHNNITLPIMVMNPSEESFGNIVAFHLEPEMYSFKILRSYLQFLNGRNSTIHLKFDTGMHRLGFSANDLDELISLLTKNKHLKVGSIFSHLAGADEPMHDAFSNKQAAEFKTMADRISKEIGYKPLYHILNSPGILRLTEHQMDMVRLGIGLYGIDPTGNKNKNLKPVATLKTFISQVRQIEKGESVGYGRRGMASTPSTIATIAIGYADGYSRAFSRGVGKVLVNGQLAPVIGNVCMDMTMIDITGINAQESDEVIIFGNEHPIEDVASSINTIPYEILTNTSERVKRVFVAESI